MITYFTDIEIVGLISAYICWLISIIVFVKGKSPKLSILLLSLGCLIWNVQGVSYDVFLNLWDERFHALVARNLADDFFKPQLYREKLLLDYDYRDWTRAQIWLHKQPFFLCLGALSIKVLGFSPFAWRLPFALLFSTIPIIAYRTGKILVNVQVGYFAAMLTGGSFWAFSLLTGRVNTDQNDLCFFVLVSASIWTFTEYTQGRHWRWILLTGIFSGLAVLTKWLPGLMIYSAWFIWVCFQENWQERYQMSKDWVISLICSIIVFLPWQIYIFIRFPIEAKQEFSHAGRHFFEVVEHHQENWNYYFTHNILLVFGWPILLLFILSIVNFFYRDIQDVFRGRTLAKRALLAMCVIVYLFYSIAATKMPSFVFPVSMLIFIMIAISLDKFITYIHTYIHTYIQ